MKKTLAILLTLMLCTATFAACTKNDANTNEENENQVENAGTENEEGTEETEDETPSLEGEDEQLPETEDVSGTPENNDAQENTPAVNPEEVEGEIADDEIAEDEIFEEEVEVSALAGIVDEIYAHKAPMFMYGTMPVDLTDEFSYTTYLGLSDVSKIEDAVVSESMIGAQAYSLVVAKVKEGQDAAAIAEEMKAGIDTRKWICVEADDVKVTTSGDLICFCMISSDFAPDFTAQDAIDGFMKAVAK